MRLEIAYPTIHHLGIRVECLDRPRMYAPLKVFLRLFVRERSAGDGPQRAFRGEGSDARYRDPKRCGGVRGKVRSELDGRGKVGAELDGRDGDAVRAGVTIRLENAAPVNHGCVPLTLFWVYAYGTKRFDCCYFALGSGGPKSLS
jgi:hypothetical protein